MMDACRLFICSLVLFYLTGEVKGALKSTTLGSLEHKKTKQQLCTTCKVTHNLKNQTARNGGRVAMKCAFQGISAKNITWLKDGKRLKENKHITKSSWSSQNGSKLRIKGLTSKHTGQYSCVGHTVQGVIITRGYLKVIRRAGSRRTTTKPRASTSGPTGKPRVGKCENYNGKLCSKYIGAGTLIFVDVQKRPNNQEFIEEKLRVGNNAGSQMFTNSCKPFSLALWCHYHFPECVVNSRPEPRMICKKECDVIKKTHCQAEYSASKKGKPSNEEDLFPDCATLPRDNTKGKCISLSRHGLHVQPKTDPRNGPASGQCSRYSGKLCKMKQGEVFLPFGVKDTDIENDIKVTLQNVKSSGRLSQQCEPYVLPLLCHLKFPDCDKSSVPVKAKPICKDECLVLKNQYCKREYDSAHQLQQDSGLRFDCSSVKTYSRESGKCSVIGIPREDLINVGSKTVSSETLPTTKPRVGICTPYQGTICKQFIGTKRTIFVDSTHVQAYVETKLKEAIKAISKFRKLSSKCEPFVLPMMCHHLFPYCDQSTQPKPSYICRDDCLHIQHHFCPAEYEVAVKEYLTKRNTLFPRCSELSKSNEGCISLQRLYTPKKTGVIPGDCYSGNGGGYRGFANTTKSGLTCQQWSSSHPHPHRLTEVEYPELRDGRNFCRNPGGNRAKPWCFTTDPKHTFELCNIPECVNTLLNDTGESYLGTLNTTSSGKACESWFKHEPKLNWAHNYCRNPNGSDKPGPWCYVADGTTELCGVPRVSAISYPASSGHLSNLLYTVIPCVLFGLVVGVVIIAVCWKRHKQGPDSMKKSTRVTVTMFLPELKTIPAENILLSKFIGNGRFGALHTGEIHSEDCNRLTRFIKIASKESREEFINQAKKWSHFHHPNILTIEAISSGDDPVTLVFEHAAHGGLYQYLIYHSPNNPNFTKDHALLTKANLLDISRQIAAGMTYLSSHDYIHGDLMTRNCQVSHSMIIKITDFSIDRDACYYRRPNKRPTPLGWMAPEAIQTEVFTVYSDVWAFGVLLWEIFTYGFQPYFGYTFPEVKKKVLDMELLERPRDCLPSVYDLMKKCWHKDPLQRPQFFDLHEDLNSVSNELLDEQDDDMESYVAPSSC